ncbi:hypothetical protein LPJ57_005818 [Coemansia sp. RSA 486]|nr:hypothetical protein LPJ57_005818 [Coemansia sp. RSA 486]
MKTEFETPSAWATAVCRVMRAQQRAKEDGKRGPSTGGVGESRVAVNGWTACRARIPKEDRNWEMAVRLDLETRGARGRKNEQVQGDIEVSLDLLRRELGLRAATTASSASVVKPVDENNSDHGSPESVEAPEEQTEDSEILGAVDGLAERVQSELALGFVGQRRAAAAAAGAITASVNPLTISALKKLASSAATPSTNNSRSHAHSRKRKSIPDMSRHAKLSRVPTENSDDMVTDPEDSRPPELLSEETQKQLRFFREKAGVLKRPLSELKTLQYQRRQQLKQRMAEAIDEWIRDKRLARTRDKENMCGPAVLPPGTRPSSAQSLRTGSMDVVVGAMPVPVDAQDSSVFGNMRPRASDSVFLPSTNDLSLRMASVWVPPKALESGAIEMLAGLCVQCASAGSELLACSGCGDRYHGFCAPPLVGGGRRFLCPACRVCCTCLEEYNNNDDLLQCDECGLLTHARCSRQEADHPGGLVGLVADSDGYWKCDRCICCLECGFRMSRSDDSEDMMDRARFSYDFALCGECAPQIEKAKVCPSCIATYTNGSPNLVCCDICSSWVHTDCDPRLSSAVYDALITLEDDAPYVCPGCAQIDNKAGGLLDDGLFPSALPLCMNNNTQASQEPPEVQLEINTEEIANMLLSLTHSDVRFGHERFDLGVLQTRFCVQHPKTPDWRQCALCKLYGDGLPTTQQTPTLGRLVPVLSDDDTKSSLLWAHIECLAWAWGPRTTGFSDGLLTMVRFDGSLTNSSICALCERSNASFHCCAPTPCYDASYHLPCLFLAGCPTPGYADDPSYCVAWRRALCPTHAPSFASMMPAHGSVESAIYANVRVEASITNLPTSDLSSLRNIRKLGNLLIDQSQESTRWSRFFSLANRSYSIHISVPEEKQPWMGAILNGFTTSPNTYTHSADTLKDLLITLFSESIPPEHSFFIAAFAQKSPMRFLNIPSST